MRGKVYTGTARQPCPSRSDPGCPERERLEALATRLRSETGRSIDVIEADLNERADLARVEEVLRNDAKMVDAEEIMNE
jgi:hypothetical protein